MNYQNGREETEKTRHKVDAFDKRGQIALITYFVLYELSIDAADKLLQAAGLSVEQIEDMWETPVKDIDIIMWTQLTGGRVRPGQ